MPMAAAIARVDLDIAPDRALGHYTHEKSPLGAAAALATLEVIESENLLERSRKLGTQSIEKLRELQQRYESIVDVRGLGLAIGVELNCHNAAERVLYDCLAKGLSFKISNGTVLTLTPPQPLPQPLTRRTSIGTRRGAALGTTGPWATTWRRACRTT